MTTLKDLKPHIGRLKGFDYVPTLDALFDSLAHKDGGVPVAVYITYDLWNAAVCQYGTEMDPTLDVRDRESGMVATLRGLPVFSEAPSNMACRGKVLLLTGADLMLTPLREAP